VEGGQSRPTANPGDQPGPRALSRLRDGARRLFAIGRHPAVAGGVETPSLAESDVATPTVLVNERAFDDWMLATTLDSYQPVGTFGFCPNRRLGK
jgi:hypothetical protein